MKVQLSANLLGFCVGGYNYTSELEIDDSDLEYMDEKEKEEYICKCVYDYILDTLDYGYEIL